MTATMDAPEVTIDWYAYRAAVPMGEEPIPGTLAWRQREEIILAYLYLTKRIVSKLIKKLPDHVRRDDLESHAVVGLIKAVQKYNHTISVPFEAFATDTMRRTIYDILREQDWAPRSLRRRASEIDKVETSLRKTLGRVPTYDEIACALQTTQDEINTIKHQVEISHHTYIESSVEATNKASLADVEVDRDFVDTVTGIGANTLLNMPVREATVIALRYYEGKKLSDVAKIMGLSDVKVGQLHAEAVLSLWQAVNEAIADDR